MIDLIAFDADDTLWHTESLYVDAQKKYSQLLAPYAAAEQVGQALHDTEMRNLQWYGYGIKSFALSMIETAIQVSAGRISGAEIEAVLALARDMLAAPIQLLDHVQETVAHLAERYPLMIITKGDLLDQEAKIARSGLRSFFRYVEIASDKTGEYYSTLLAKYGLTADHFLMVGNSLRSDILPVVALGGRAVHVPYPLTWIHENVSIPAESRGKYYEVEHLGRLKTLVDEIGQGNPV